MIHLFFQFSGVNPKFGADVWWVESFTFFRRFFFDIAVIPLKINACKGYRLARLGRRAALCTGII